MKKMNLIALFLASLVLFSVKTSVAQNTTFKLSDYKNPDYLYQSLDLNFGLNSGLNRYRYKGFENNSYNYFSLNSQAGAVYKRFVNSPKAQGDLYISFDAGIGSTNGNADYTYSAINYNSESEHKTFNHTEGLDISGLHRFYNQKQNFIEINGSLSLYDFGKSDKDKTYSSGNITTSQETKEIIFQNSIQGAFFVGKGRIEQVQDARMALYLLDDLFLLNRAKRSLSDEDANDLAQLITRLKYKRFFDSRLRQIAEITAIDSFMQKKGIVTAADAVYFTSLNDNWAYANNPVRYSGHRLFAGLEASFGYDHHDEYLEKTIPDYLSNENIVKQTTGGIYLVLGYAFEKPVNLKWQNSANIQGSAGIRQHSKNTVSRISPNPETELNFYSESSPAINLSADYGFGYYPSSRTWMTLNWWLNSGWEKQKQGDSKEERTDLQNNFYAYTGPQLQAYYYLSEKLRLSFSVQGQFQFDNNKFTIDLPEESVEKATRTSWNQSVNAALTYSLF